MSLITALAHVCIKTTDLRKTREFYCDALGLRKLFDFTRHGQVIGFYLAASPTTFIEVFLENQISTSMADRALHHFCLETDRIKAVRETLLQHGYMAGELKLGVDQSWQFWTQDPSGVDIEFHAYTAQSSQRTGENVEVDW